MDFSIKPKITKSLILSEFSEEQIMSYYLNIPIKKGLFRSPLRKDINPTCSLYRNKSGTLIFKDFATGQYLNCFEVVQAKYNCNYFEALNIIANDFNIVHNKILHKNSDKIIDNSIKIKNNEIAKIQVEIQNFTPYELKWWKKYGITLDLLKKYKVFSCKHVFLNGNIIAESSQNCPIFGYYGGNIKKNKEKIELWRCYFPKRKSYRFITNWPSKKIQGFDQIIGKGKLLIITKSMKDLLCFRSIGLEAIAPNSETQFLTDSILNNLKQNYKHIIVLFDNDQTGISFMNKIKKKHPELLYTWIPFKYKAKDISDFYKKYGRDFTIKTIKDYIIWLKKVRKI